MLRKSLRLIKFFLTVLATDASFVKSYVHNRYYLKKAIQAKGSEPIIFVSLIEHLGDLIAASPLIEAIREKHKREKIVFFTAASYSSVLSQHKSINEIKTVSCFAEWVLLKKHFTNGKLYDLNLPGKACSKYPFNLPEKGAAITTSNYYQKGNLLHAFATAANFKTDTTAAPYIFYSYKSTFRLTPHPYIILHTTANEADRMWNTTGWNELAAYVAQQKSQWKIIEIGTTRQLDLNIPQYIDYTGIKPLAELTGLIKNAELFIGVDSAFAHVANALEKESLILLGHYANFTHYLPYSGFFQKKQKQMLVHYSHILAQMPFSFIEQRLLKKFNSTPEA